jgi:hypothetical protein
VSDQTATQLHTEQANGQVTRVRFGDGPCQDLPLNLAEAVLRRVWAKSPAQFGALLRQAMIDTWPSSSAHQNGHQQ